MAGMGKRMRPHTLLTPKPLLPVAGKPIVQHLVESLVKSYNQLPEEVAFIVGNFGEEAENKLLQICKNLGVNGKIYYQLEALGTAHAINCAAESLDSETIIAFADTLFKADFRIDTSCDSIIWVHKVSDPSAFGVVVKNERNEIVRFEEKPTQFVSDEAIIGIYYFKDGENLKNEIKYLLDNDVKKGGEYQLTDALINMMNQGKIFYSAEVEEWLDCGNKDATVHTNQRMLEFLKDTELIDQSAEIVNSVINEPCCIGSHVKIINSVIGPHVSIGSSAIINHSVITNSIIMEHAKICHAIIDNSMVGNYAEYHGAAEQLSLGDYSTL
jgi:glucose-1-phosphate thymidylyltransferase